MNQRFSIGLWPRLILLGICIASLGVSPHPHAFSKALEQAAFMRREGLPSQASQALAQAAQLLPWRADLWEQAGSYALQAGEAQTAIEYFRRAWRADPVKGLSASGWLALGDAYCLKDDMAEAIRAWQAGMGRYGRTKEGYQRLAQAYLALGDYTSAVPTLQFLADLDMEDAQARYRLGLLLAARRPEEAGKHLEQAAQLDARYKLAADEIRRSLLSARFADDRAYTLLAVGRALASLNEWNLAIEAFHQAVQMRPDYAEAWAYLGEARQHYGVGAVQLASRSTSDGLQELETALQLDPNSLAAHTFLALYWTRQSRYDQAKETIQKAAALDPENPALLVQLASIQAASGELYNAYETYRKAIELSPYDPIYRRSLIEFAIEYDFEIETIALPMARQLAARFPKDPQNQDLLGRLLLKQGDLTSAERFFRRALELDPLYAAAHMHLGLIYALRGERVAALNELDMAISLASGTPTAAQAQRLIEMYFP